MAKNPSPTRHRPRRLAGLAVILAGTAVLSGCLLTGPTHNQALDHHTDPVPLSAWTVSASHPVVFECAQAYHGGLYPPFSAPTWHHVATRWPAGGGLDGDGIAAYMAGGSYVLPASCWRQDPANDVWYAGVRARQTGAAGPTDGFFTLDAAGLACVGQAVGQSASWLGWLGKGCHRTYANSNTAVPYVIIHAAA